MAETMKEDAKDDGLTGTNLSIIIISIDFIVSVTNNLVSHFSNLHIFP